MDLHPAFSKPAGHRGMEILEDPKTGKQLLKTYIKVPQYLNIAPSKSEAVRGQPEALVSLLFAFPYLHAILTWHSGSFIGLFGHFCSHSSTTASSWMPCESQLSRATQCLRRLSHITTFNKHRCSWLFDCGTWAGQLNITDLGCSH